MGVVDGDGVLDLVVGSGNEHAPEVVIYAGKSTDGSGAFAPFGADMRGGVSVAAAQIDRSTADNIVLGSGPGTAGEVRVYGFGIPAASGQAPPLFASFKPNGDRSGVSLATGFVDYATGRTDIVTAPGPGSPSEVKVFASRWGLTRKREG
ncbi:hypothetical protein [Chelatococcus reniformis]|uniref:VCBS repeat-containing protein n=1 Tax=Chelatococcus reniformis TaxID=1494448 RepID=A0A916XPX9_9HYPH|nr:hypothetical protein [Chelatococcus reniformis]GGC89859.1 hypothetical protein GCM10010994_54640 [Chelatococcus reniformis]